MTQTDLDRRLAALLAEPDPARDPLFADRIIALAAFDRSRRLARRRSLARAASEAAALASILVAFVLLGEAPDGTLAGLGDRLQLASPAMFGVALLGLWALVGSRDEATVSG